MPGRLWISLSAALRHLGLNQEIIFELAGVQSVEVELFGVGWIRLGKEVADAAEPVKIPPSFLGGVARQKVAGFEVGEPKNASFRLALEISETSAAGEIINFIHGHGMVRQLFERVIEHQGAEENMMLDNPIVELVF